MNAVPAPAVFRGSPCETGGQPRFSTVSKAGIATTRSPAFTRTQGARLGFTSVIRKERWLRPATRGLKRGKAPAHRRWYPPQGACRRRPGARRGRKETPDGLPVHSFRTLIDDLASVVVNVIRLPGAGQERTTIVTRRTRLQSRAFELLEVNPDRTVPINLTG